MSATAWAPSDPYAQSGSPDPHRHIVQFYEQDTFLVAAVGDYLAAGLQNGEPAVVIATQAHRSAFALYLVERGLDVRAAEQSGLLTMLDASETLRKFMGAGGPDAARFESIVGDVLKATAARSDTGHFRAYGEMVDLLWRDGKRDAAIRLEELWNDIGSRYSFSLLCAYVMRNFDSERDASGFAEVCRTHSHVVPTEKYLFLTDPDSRAREVSILQQRARALESEVEHRRRVETDLREAIKVRDDFLCVAGHELRTPLTVLRLQLASLLTSEGASQTPRTERRLATLATQTERLARLAERLVDAAQLADRLTLNPEAVDLAALVRDVAAGLTDVAGAAGCHLTIQGEATVVGCWDRDRLEQVVQDLLTNAFKFGSGKPVEIIVRAEAAHAEVVVRDGGIGISSDDRERIFDRFERGVPTASFGGLGLGLWIAKRIVAAHGGRIEVESRLGAGATFTIRLPYTIPSQSS